MHGARQFCQLADDAAKASSLFGQPALSHGESGGSSNELNGSSGRLLWGKLIVEGHPQLGAFEKLDASSNVAMVVARLGGSGGWHAK